MKITRFPITQNKSLQAWNAADELILIFLQENDSDINNIAIYNDRFGFLTCNLLKYNPIPIISYKSQKQAIINNFENNNLDLHKINFQNPLGEIPERINTAIIKIPKSMELYRLYLEQICQNSEEESIVIAAFMTKYFSPQMISIAEEYFTEVSQSKAHKKARLIIMKGKKAVAKTELLQNIEMPNLGILQQYYGVFSSQHIDFATQFLLEHFQFNNKESNILDLASGNGVIAHFINSQYKIKGWQLPHTHLLDDSFLAIESSKLNLHGENIHFHYGYDFSEIKDDSLDLIISNPPFHFEYEINIEVSLDLFRQAYKSLKLNGRMVIVYNMHLNYKSQLQKIFSEISVLKQNDKFVVLECLKR